METVVLTPRFEEDYDEKRIEFVDSNNNIVCTGFFVPFQFVIHPYFNSFESYNPDNKFNNISGYSHSMDELLIMSININSNYIDDSNSKLAHNLRKDIFYNMIQDAIRDYTLKAFKEDINVVIENGYNDKTETMENSSLYRYVRYYYSNLLGSNLIKSITPNKNSNETENVEYPRRDLIKNKEFINENIVHNEDPDGDYFDDGCQVEDFNEFMEEDNPAYTKADDPEKGLNFIYD